MAQKVLERVDRCKACDKNTLHYRNTKEMSWIMHLVLTIFTAGAWLIVWFFLMIWHVLTKPLGGGGWTCSECGAGG